MKKTLSTTERMARYRAFREAVADTAVAFSINVPLNFVMVWVAFQLKFSAWQTSIMLTTVFTVFAIVRKTYIRLHFQKKYQKTGSYESNEPK
jgi:hypothetical protein